MEENILINNKHVFMYDSTNESKHYDYDYIKQNFCGQICNSSNYDIITLYNIKQDTLIYSSLTTTKLLNILNKINENIGCKIYVIQDFSLINCSFELINLNRIPLYIKDIGLYFKNMYDDTCNYFDKINNAHKFQTLTESNKLGTAYRKGIYLTNVNKYDNEIKFNLLRCSTNFNGPTENFHKYDNEIIDKINMVADAFFKQPVKLNHVLAQIYENYYVNNGIKIKEKKAKIKEHSDKTKDMPKNGLIVFVTFYNSNKKINDNFLTKLRFKLKDCDNDNNLKMTKKIDIILYPNSVLIIPLSTNRMYTHEIIPSSFPINKIPIRMGYVIRCSKEHVTYKNNQTYLSNGCKLEYANENDIKEIKIAYALENLTNNIINYKDFNFSLNSGDYIKPII